ncbi:DUF5020 domain-containing protein [Psychromonas sp. B3M02]|uniref:DUF5020 domain-containing protein n=1 Tax=Psychromonas sp. B3M02 TaxID=2267226 RepID=UPI000DE9DA08|nr:DUF5020 domain-containing protein [Psychromonas sp. B3M02]RBW46660.1 DUF5020 domain-containing protein [Psychromonas sp. B3M02]
MKLTTIGKLAILPVLACHITNASAEQLWSDFSLSGLVGSEYVDPFSSTEDTRKVFTFEHASGHNWGGTFLFVDRLSNPDDTYGEFSINPTLYKDDSLLKSVFLATQVEFSSGDSNFNNYLMGLGVSLAVPGANYFNITYYRRFQDDLGIDRGDNNQLTVTWQFDKGNFRFDGFLDIVDSADTAFGDTEAGFNFTPQIKYNIAPMLDLKTGRLDVGIEYVYWKNKFGVDGETENNPNLLVKWHF